MMEGGLCVVCSAPCTKQCANCRNVFYCSKEHQDDHWEKHNKECHLLKIVTQPDKGRVLIATKAMPPYSIIIQEHSIINLPSDESNKLYGKICVSCCKISEHLESCSKCSAPVCGRDCELAKIHANYECRVFPSKSNYGAATSCSKLMAIIRCLLLKRRNKEKYDVLKTLQSNLGYCMRDDNAAEGFLQNASKVDVILKDVELDDYDQDEILTIIGIIRTNSFMATSRDVEGNVRSSIHLYATTSIASHSCFPNARPIIRNSGRVKLIATRRIAAEEEITIAYCGFNEGTVERQKKLQAGFYFSCKCARCRDPTELGTHFSSVKCLRPLCLDGYLLPKLRWDRKQDLETEEVWMCSNCPNKDAEGQIQKLLATLDKKVVDIQMKSRLTNAMTTITALQALIGEYSGDILHPNHYLLFSLKNTIAEMVYNNLEVHSKMNLSEQGILSLKQTLAPKCKKLLTICNKLCPGPNKIRGQLLYMLWKGMQDDTYNQKMETLTALPQEERHAIPDFIKELMTVAEEALQILLLEPDGIIYRVWITELQRWIRMVQEWTA